MTPMRYPVLNRNIHVTAAPSNFAPPATVCLDRSRQPGPAQAHWIDSLDPTGRVSFVLFLALNAALFLRPSELLPACEQIPFYEILILACSLASIRRIFAQLTIASLIRTPITVCILCLLPVAALSHLTHFSVWEARIATSAQCKLIIYYFLVVAHLSSATRIQCFLGCLATFATTLCILSLLNYHEMATIPALAPYVEQQQDILDPETGEPVLLARLSGVGIFNNPNDMARLIVMGLVISTGFALRRGFHPLQLLWLAPITVLSVGLLRTYSRGGFLGFLSGLAVLLLFRFHYRKGLVVALITIPLALLAFKGRITNITTSGGTGQGRIQLWAEGITYFSQRPVFGIGMDEFSRRLGYAPHNSFFQYYVELGFLGGTAFLGSFFIASRGVSEAGKLLSSRSSLRGLRPGLCALLGAYAAGLLTCNRAYGGPTYTVLGTASAFLILVERESSNFRLQCTRQLVFRLVRISILFLLVLYLYVQVFVSWSAE